MSGPVFAEANAFADQFPLDVVMAVETVGDRKRQEGTDTWHGAQNFIPDIEIIVRFSGSAVER